MKFNPFKPNSMAGPGMFSGRFDELQTIEKCLFQTRHGNPQHFLIEGERGIGKSSLLLFVNALATGTVAGLSGGSYSFLVISVDLSQCDTVSRIVREIGVGLKGALSERTQLKEKAKAVWEFLTNWEVLGVRYHREEVNIDEGTLASDLVHSIAGTLESSKGEMDGILILLDEADRPPEDAQLGAFLKLFTERLQRKDCGNCVIGMAGLPTLIPKMRASHESSPRVFETMTLAPLERHESSSVVEAGIKIANETNPIQTSISPDALELISVLSEGYPHFIQQFAYCAFEADRDNSLDATDVVEGAFSENGALAQLGHKYFNKMYFENVTSESYRSVLNAMARHGNEWVNRKVLIEEANVGAFIVGNALRALTEREIIIQDSSRRGYYKLPTQSFATWINAIKSVEEKAGKDAVFRGNAEAD